MNHRDYLMTLPFTSVAAQRRLLLLTAILFLAYLCIGISLPVVPLYVTARLGLSNVWAGLAVGIAFLATILSRGRAGALADQRGAKTALVRGLSFYLAGALVVLAAGLVLHAATLAYLLLMAGRLLTGVGESLAAVGVITWGIALVGPARSGQVLALVGAAIYGALAVGGPIGIAVFDRSGLVGTMSLSALLPLLGLLCIWRVNAPAVATPARRPSFWSVTGQIWQHGAIVCLQGIGFAAIGAYFTLYFRDHHWSYAGLGLTAFGSGFVLVRVLFGQLPDRLGGLPVAIASLAVETIGQVLIWTAGDPLLALLGAFLTGLGCSLIFPAMGREVVQLVAPHLRGTALGSFAAFQDVAYGLTGPLAGLLADWAGYRSVFLSGAAAALAGLLLTLTLALRRARAAALR